MDQGEILQQFISMTGAETEFALSFLEANGYDLETSINLYLEGNMGAAGNIPPPKALSAGGAGGDRAPPPHRPSTPPHHDVVNEQGGGMDARTMSDADIARAMSDIPPEIYDSAMYEPGGMDDDGVRAPIMPHSETLVEDDPYLRHLGRRRPAQSNNVFEMFRDFSRESRMTPKAGADDQNSKKLKTLADLFKPPLDLLEPGSFEHVKNVAKQRKRWLLINIQESSEFDCQKLNRDTWSDMGVKSVVSSGFVLWQVLKPTEDGQRYCRYYPVEILPHLGIIDPRTGERIEVWEGFVEPAQLIEMLEKFLRTHSLDDTRPVKPRGESPKKLGDLSEEAQIAAAVAASLGQDGQEAAAAVLASNRSKSTPTATATSTSTSTSASASTPTPTPTPTSTKPTASTSTSTTNPPVAPVAAPTTTTTSTPATATTPAETKPAVPAPPADLIAAHSNPTPELTCVIQIRTPTGPIKGHFRPTDTLLTVHQYTSLHLEPNKQFALITNFPKKVFTGEQLNLTLQQADLVPRAVLNCEMS